VLRELPLLLGLLACLLAWLDAQQGDVLRPLDGEVNRLSALAAMSTVEASMAAGGEDRDWALLAARLSPGEGENVRIVDVQGRVLHPTDPEPGESVQPLTDPSCALCHEGGVEEATTRSLFLPTPGDGRTTLSAVPLFNGGACRACHAADGPKLGVVFVEHPIPPTARLVQRSRIGLITAAALAYVVSVLVTGLVLRRYIDRPLKHLLKGAREIGAGNLDSTVELPEKSELSVLADTFNRSTAQLRESIQQIEYQRDDLQTLYHIADQLGQSVEPGERRRRAVELVGTIFESDCLLIAGYFHAESDVFHGTLTYRDEGSEVIEDRFEEGDGVLGVSFYAPNTVERWLRGELDGEFLVREGPTVAFPLERRGRRLGLIMAPALKPSEYADGRVTAANPLVVRAFLKHLALALDLSELRREYVRQGRLAAIGGIVAGLSHCLKNTLNGLRGGLYVVDRAMENKNPERLAQGWKVLSTSVHQIERLSLNMLYFSRDHRPKLERIDPNQILREVVDLLGESSASQGVTVSAELDDEIGAMPLDRLAIYRAVLNLATNAVDACVDAETGGDAVLVRSAAAGDELRIVIEDNGIGMSELTRKRMYEQFFSTKHGKGTGLGLPVVKKILEEHGGSLAVESSLGVGTTFTIHLPRVTDEE